MSIPSVVVDINRIEALKGLARTDQATRIGAITRQNDIVGNEMLTSALPVLVCAVSHVGHHQTRNRGMMFRRLNRKRLPLTSCGRRSSKQRGSPICRFGLNSDISGRSSIVGAEAWLYDFRTSPAGRSEAGKASASR